VKFYFRTGKNTGVGVGPIRAVFVGMLYVCVLAVGLMVAAAYLVGLILAAVGRWAFSRKRGHG
jgi:hypothetical protein